ncbi:MAG: radical SAM protein [Bacillota bacterium]|nr:radical SAM protein [Bacillota bacterium]
MSVLSTLSRMYLTRSLKPFVFTDNNESHIEYQELMNLGLYVHIPFCRSICKFCPYCKVKYDPDVADKYIDALLMEIDLVCAGKKKRKATSVYFGGGSPALLSDRIGEIIARLATYFDIEEGAGIELHPGDVKEETLDRLRKAGVSKISIGIQSFNNKYQHTLGRKHIDIENLRRMLSAFHFETVSMDFIFALPGQTFEDLQKDLDTAFEAGANHVAIYPFINFAFTKNEISEMKKGEKRLLLDRITSYLLDQGCVRKSIWTFASEEDVSYSSMTRDNFLGFGCSATTLLERSFKINTFSVEDYIRLVNAACLPTSLTIQFTLRQRMIYYLFWALYGYKMNVEDFEAFFGKDFKTYYGREFALAEKLGFLVKENNAYHMTLKGAFYYHHYENFYTYSYIDKMWGVLSRNAFPKTIRL